MTLPSPRRYRYVLLGEAPNRAGEQRGLAGQLAFRSAGLRARGRLAWLRAYRTLLTEDPDLGAFVRWTADCNLLDAWPGPSGRGSAWPTVAALEAAQERLPLLLEAFPLVLLAGRRVADACGYGSMGWLERAEGGRAMVVPHPSGVSRWWQAPGRCEYVADVLRTLGRDASPRGVEVS